MCKVIIRKATRKGYMMIQGNFVLAILGGLFFFVLYYGMIFCVSKRCGLFKHYSELSRKEQVIISLLLIFITIYFYWICAQDNKIVSWDSGFYWIKNINFSQQFFQKPIDVLLEVYKSVDLTDYSDVVPIIMSIPFLVIGRESYDLYRLLLFIMFHIPTYILLTELVNQVVKKLGLKGNKYSYALTMFFVLAISFMYLPTVYGLFDVADMVVACAIALLLLSYDYRRFSAKDALLLSVLFLALLFIRRHFAFFALGYFACFVLADIFYAIFRKKWTVLWEIIKNSLVVGGICGSVLLIFFRNYLIRTLMNNYDEQYSARSYGTMLDKYIVTLKWMGLGIVLLALVGVVALIVKKAYKLLFVLVVSTVFIMYMYFRIQSLSMQHYYNFAIQIILLMCIGLFAIGNLLKNSKICLGIEILVMFLFFAQGFIPAIKFGNSVGLLPTVAYQPEKRTDLAVIEQILEDAKKLAVESESTAYCIASSLTMNDDILRNYYLPEPVNSFPELCRTHNTDLADGFPWLFCSSDVIIATSPSQIHANADGQRVVWVLNEMMISQESELRDNFKEVNRFKIDGDVEVILYQKIKAFEEADFELLLSTFNEWYSDYPELFENRIKEQWECAMMTYESGQNTGCIVLGENGYHIASQKIIPKYGEIDNISFQIGTNGQQLAATLDVRVRDANGNIKFETSVDLSQYGDFEFVQIPMSGLLLEKEQTYGVEFEINENSETKSILLLTAECADINTECASVDGTEQDFNICIKMQERLP